MKLTEHFWLSEFERSNEAARQGIDNSIPADLLPNVKRLAERLELVRALTDLPLMISSGYRSPAVNVAAKGSKHSRHMLGLAADIDAGIPTRELFGRIRSSSISFDQLIMEYPDDLRPYAGWVHFGIGLEGVAERQEVLIARRVGKKTETVRLA